MGVGFATIAAATAASGPSWTDIVTAIGTVLAGWALPLAFIQLEGPCARTGCADR